MSLLPQWRDEIERFHAQNAQCVLAVTGGGASLIGDLLAVPGGSNTILEAVVPYSASAFTDWLKRTPEQFCSAETALAMATTACLRAESLAQREGRTPLQPLGFGCTASLVSTRPKRGAHRCHIAVQTATLTCRLECELEKGARHREAEEDVVAQLSLECLLWSAGLQKADPGLTSSHLGSVQLEKSGEGEQFTGDRTTFRSHTAAPLVHELFHQQRGLVWSLPDGMLAEKVDAVPVGVLCGAFNPLHAGHEELRRVAEQILGGPVWYELCIRNVDKPPLDFLTIEDRRQQFTQQPLALTCAPTFAAKSRVLPGVTFVIGVDTAARIVQPRYYGDDEAATCAALDEIRANGCRFLTAARVQAEQLSRPTELADLDLPAEFANLFIPIPVSDFRSDLSSTALRKKTVHDE